MLLCHHFKLYKYFDDTSHLYGVNVTFTAKYALLKHVTTKCPFGSNHSCVYNFNIYKY